MALSASSTTIDVTNTATKTTAPQNDLFRNVSIRLLREYAHFDAAKLLWVQRYVPLFYDVQGWRLFPAIPIELMIAHAAAAHPSPPRSRLHGKAGKHEGCWPHVELISSPGR